ncbi:MAG: tRNA dihydrouridine synthase DusB [Clostridia bacterium]|nr:tRNA dihydrouridine synthase DusB [Clostridia bacterium]
MKIGNLEIKNNVFLAPMAGITDMAFRKICKEYGAGLVYTEMVSSKGMHYKDDKTNLLTAVADEERPAAVQIFGSDPDIMADAAEKIAEYADIIDINMGCPAPKVVKNDDGSKLMLNLELVDKITEKVVKASKVPVTVKTRKGWDDEHITAVEIAKMCEKNGVAAIAIHGRTRNQFYTGKADWDIIADVKRAVSIPVIGNGDIVDVESAKRMIEYTKCDGIMIGRAAIGNPWIFKSIAEGANYVPSKEEIYDVIEKHYNNLIELKGEYVAVREMRKHISYYIKGVPNATEMRRRINETTQKDEVIKILEENLI